MTPRGLLVVLVLTWLPITAGHEALPCGTCSGSNEASLPCETCLGTGRGPCYVCLPHTILERAARKLLERRRDGLEVPEDAEEILREATASLERLGSLMPGTAVAPIPGKISCPGWCREGQSHLNPGFRCLACRGKGLFTCPACKGKALGPCTECGGEGAVRGPCPECAGSGAGRDLLVRSAASLTRCPWCEGARQMRCRACNEEGLRLSSCLRCAGTGKYPCQTCKGTLRDPCNKCHATGDLSRYLAEKTSDRCDLCRRKGWMPCEPCFGTGKAVRPCSACDKSHQARCGGGALGGGLAWRLTGERLLAAGRAELAARHLELALTCEKDRTDWELEVFTGPRKDREARRRWYEKQLTDLRRTLARARAAAADG